jgi:hypothetical protein
LIDSRFPSHHAAFGFAGARQRLNQASTDGVTMQAWKTSALAVVSAIAIGAVAVGPADAARIITGQQIQNNTITGSDIKNKSLTAADFKGSVAGRPGPAGTPGPAGPAGTAGTPGAAGTIASTIEPLGPDVATGASGTGTEVQASKAECPPGTVVTGGGYRGGVRTFIADAHKSGNGYFVIAVNYGSLDASIQASAICGTAPAAATPRVTATQPDVRDAERERLAEVRAQVIPAQ